MEHELLRHFCVNRLQKAADEFGCGRVEVLQNERFGDGHMKARHHYVFSDVTLLLQATP
jgi:hypothetical protein